MHDYLLLCDSVIDAYFRTKIQNRSSFRFEACFNNHNHNFYSKLISCLIFCQIIIDYIESIYRYMISYICICFD